MHKKRKPSATLNQAKIALGDKSTSSESVGEYAVQVLLRMDQMRVGARVIDFQNPETIPYETPTNRKGKYTADVRARYRPGVTDGQNSVVIEVKHRKLLKNKWEYHRKRLAALRDYTGERDERCELITNQYQDRDVFKNVLDLTQFLTCVPKPSAVDIVMQTLADGPKTLTEIHGEQIDETICDINEAAWTLCVRGTLWVDITVLLTNDSVLRIRTDEPHPLDAIPVF